MKILIVTPYMPYPLDSGGSQAQFQMIDGLRRKAELSVLFPLRKENDPDYLSLKSLWPDVTFYPYVGEEPTPADGSLCGRWLKKSYRSLERKLQRLETAKETDLIRSHTTLFSSSGTNLPSGLIDFVAAVSRQGFDIVQTEFFEFVSLVYVLPESVKRVFVQHEIRFIRNELEMGLLAQPKSSDRWNYEVARAFETVALKRYDAVVTLTEVDREIMKTCVGHDAVYASPAFVCTEAAADERSVDYCKRVVFVGSGFHFPNLDGVDWFSRDIMPRIRKEEPETEFCVVGRWGKQQKDYPGIRFLGFVDDLGSVLQGSVSVAPIRIGSGMRIKLLDSVKYGSPFVTTSKGVEGLDFRHGRDCLIADTPQAFADAVVRLLRDPELCRSYARSARRALPAEAGWVDKRYAVYCDILA